MEKLGYDDLDLICEALEFALGELADIIRGLTKEQIRAGSAKLLKAIGDHGADRPV